MFAVIESVLQSKIFKFFICILLGIYVYFMIIAPISNGLQSAISTWKEWQTFNAAIIAFLSTLLIVHSTKIAEQKNMLRKRNSTKAFMPIALAEISDYLVELIKLLDELHQEKKEFKLEFKPQLPEAAFKRIEKFIEQSSNQDEKLIEHLTIVINSAQVYDSRITSILTDNVISNKKDRAFDQITQCTLLHALVSGMFNFARGIDESYQVAHLNSDRFSIKDCPLYMTDPEIEKYKNNEIEFKLFVSG